MERFVYDDNNRLINWSNPVTGEMHHNVYDKQGRIIENDELGKISFKNGQKIYQPTGIELNSKGEAHLKNNLIQKIVYNENNDPVFIDGVRGDVRFEYGLTEMRQQVSFGGNIEDKTTGEGRYTRYYSEDGSFEITLDHKTGEEKHILYIGGSPYESNIIFVKDYKESSGSYRFLHKDYLGSILAITGESGNKLEQRHYDAWGNLTHLQIGGGRVLIGKEVEKGLGQMLIDRGYTGHEHFFEVGVIHMNGRLYDPMLRRFLNADENIQDPHNTQNYNKYGYVYNNPLMFNDPSGEFIIPLIFIASYAIVNLTVDLIKNGFNMNIGQIFGSLGRGALQGALAYIQASLGLPFPSLIQTAILSNIPTPSLDFKLGSWNFSLSLSFNFGQGFGIGLNASIGYDDGHFSASMGFGITGWGHHFATGKSGFESRISAMTGYRGRDFGLSLGTNFWGGSGDMKEFKQQTGVLSIKSGDWSFTYENDGVPLAFSKKDYSGHALLSPRLGDGNDSYRTNAVAVSYQEMSIGINLFTGRRDKQSFKNEVSGRHDGIKGEKGPYTIGKYGEAYKYGIVNETGTKYRFGGLYLGVGNYRIGVNSEWIRHVSQNIFAHGIISHQRMFQMLSDEWSMFSMYKTKNQFTTW